MAEEEEVAAAQEKLEDLTGSCDGHACCRMLLLYMPQL